MNALLSQDPAVEPVYLKTPGTEPLPGYILIEPLGRGGYGEVWKCEAPGGLLKAIKFVSGDPEGQPREESLLRQEYEAFQQVKAIRHPFLLCLERVELIGTELIMVMGLADRHIGDRFNECRAQGSPGIPRDELLGYLREAAEALDVIGTQHGLQHLDVKPANLFLTAGHLQVGDYGLVSKLDGGTESGSNRGLTPKYAAPEVLRGKVHTHSDQYSLALVYCELLTGHFPFLARSAQQMMMQHISVPPDLSALVEPERRPVGMALAKNPEERYPSCRDFIDALARCRMATPRLSTVTTVLHRPGPLPAPQSQPRPQPPLTLPPLTNPSTLRPFGSDTTKQVAGQSTASGMPRLVGVGKPQTPASAPTRIMGDSDCVSLTTAPPPAVLLPTILPLYSVARLEGGSAPPPRISACDLAALVLKAAGFDPAIHVASDAIMQDSETSWSCRFPSTIDPRVAAVKLGLVRDEFKMTCERVDDRCVVFREIAPVTGFFGSLGKKPSGFEVTVRLPEQGSREPEVVAQASFFGKPSVEFLRAGEKGIVRLLESIRLQLNNTSDSKRHPRVPADFPLSLYPLYSDGRVDPPIGGWTINVSAAGLTLRVAKFPMCKDLYVSFGEVKGIQDLAILVRTARRKEHGDGVLIAANYQFDA